MRGYGKLLVLVLVFALMMPVYSGAQAAELDLVVTLDKETVAVDLGESITGSWKASGGTGEYSYECDWIIFENGVPMNPKGPHYIPSGTSDTLRPNYGEQGILEIIVSDGVSTIRREARFVVTGSPVVPPLMLDAALRISQVEVGSGQGIALNFAASGGEKPYRYDVTWLINGNGIARLSNLTVNEADFLPETAGNGIAIVAAKDNKDRVVYGTYSFQVLPSSGEQNRIGVSVTVADTQLIFGEDEAINYNWTIIGGQPPYLVHMNIPYTGGNGYYNTQSHSVSSFEGKLPLSEMMYFSSGEMYLEVEDAAGNTASSNRVSITMQDGSPVSGSVSISKYIMAPGDSVVAAGSMTGGKPPYTFYSAALSYSKPDDPMFFTPTVVPVDGKVTFVIPADAQPGQATFWIDAKDSAGRVLYLNVSGTVVASGASTLPGDANGDNLLNIADLQQMIDYIVNGTMPAAPVNANPVRDLELDMQDVLWVIERLVGT